MINVGIIGLGRSGWELHALPLSGFSGYRVAAVCERGDARRASAAETFKARPYREAGELLADDEVDLVVVSAPSNLHAELTVAALDAGKHVIVEKPMALTLAEADRMLAAAERNQRLLTVFHNRHWDRDYQMLKELVRQGILGDLLTLDSRVMTYGPEWTTYGVPDFNPTWRIQAAYGGGFLADWGPHLVEQLLDLTGEMPTTVTCELRSGLWAREVEDYFHLRLELPSGLLATLEGSNNARLPLPRWFVVGRTGTLVADGAWGKWTDMQIRGTVSGVAMDLAPQDIGPSSGGRNYDVGEELSARFYEDLADALANDRPSEITAQRARDVMAVLEAARSSNASGQTVTL
ncbi:MAG: Gfo/Idh/MocA family oxidoreductase [Chloroflexi bacterium]|nr:Gfo/Idh/MocA family oxidoreductase [Chloroflexota bacterium]